MKNELQEEKTYKYVVDASMAGINNLFKIIKEKTIVLTSLTIKELDKLQKNDINSAISFDARKLLLMAANGESNIELVQIEEKHVIADDNIIDYCSNNKNDVILLTADKVMAINARMKLVNVQYYTRDTNKKNKSRNTFKSPDNLFSFNQASWISGKMVITDFNTEKNSICVISDNHIYYEGWLELKVGDNIYIITKKGRYIKFTHYEVVTLSQEKNCKIVYSKRFYKSYTRIDVPKKSYKDFIEYYRVRHDA